MVWRRILVIGCVASVAAASQQVPALGAAGAPKPDPAPASRGGQLRPDPAPGASAPTVSSASRSTSASTPYRSIASSPVPSSPGSTTPRSTAFTSTRPRPVVAKQPPANARVAVPTRRTRLKAPGRSWRTAPSLGALRPGSSSNESTFLLLAAGLTLLMLVIGETTFLAFAESRFGLVPSRPRGRCSAEAAYSVQRVLLRR
jgi:hypothetical protein